MMNNLVNFYLFTMLCNIFMLFFCNKIYFAKKEKKRYSVPKVNHTNFSSDTAMCPTHVTIDRCNGSKPVNPQVYSNSFILD